MATGAEIREYDDEELVNKLLEARKELFNLRFQAATGRLDNNSRVTQVRRDIARLMTVQRAREIEHVESEAAVGPRGGGRTKEQ